MILYHGSTEIIEFPKIIKTEVGRDFGFGFYTTTIKEQAERWAIRRAKLLAKKSSCKKSFTAVINSYNFDEDIVQTMNQKIFDSTSMEWLEFIIKCRSDLTFEHSFDIVYGKIANDTVGETISFVLSGVMRKEDALERLNFEKINNQLCFHSEKSFQALSFINSEIVETFKGELK